MDKLDEAVASFVQRLETAIAPGLSIKQFITAELSIRESVMLELGDLAINHSMHKILREKLEEQRARLQEECEKLYLSRCREAHKQLFEGADDLRQSAFQHFSEYAKDSSCVERDWDAWTERFLSACGQEGQGQGAESQLLLEVLKSSAVQVVANVSAEAQQQVMLHKQALLEVNELVDQSSLDIIRLQGKWHLVSFFSLLLCSLS